MPAYLVGAFTVGHAQGTVAAVGKLHNGVLHTLGHCVLVLGLFEHHLQGSLARRTAAAAETGSADGCQGARPVLPAHAAEVGRGT